MLSLALAAGTVYEYTLDTPQIVTKGGFSSVVLTDAQIHGTPGQPALPWIGSKLLLPVGTEATGIKIALSNPKVFQLDKAVEPIQPQQPFSRENLPPPVGPDPSVYGSDSVFPAEKHSGVNTQYLSGHPINFSAVCPFEYHPLSGELVFYRNVRVEVESSFSEKAMAATNLLKKEATITNRLMESVDNAIQVPRYPYRTTGNEYLIIYDTAKYSQWLPLSDLYTQKGMNVEMVPIQTILAQSTGADNQAKIRNYIINYYAANSLLYVLLAGDTDLITHRGFYVNMGTGGETDADIPADMYYSCLDGTWNNDNDNYWGEPYETDLAPEIAIGRFCYNSDAEIANFINKVTSYTLAPVVSEAKTALFIGEWLWDGPTWGGDYMDEMIGGSSAHGYTTAGVPSSWNINTLYDRTYGYEEAWGPTQLFPLLSQGPNLVNHLGHSNTTYCMRMNNNQVTTNNIGNNGSTHNYSIYFTQGCYAGSFDNRTTNSGQYTSDCITEKYTALQNAAVSMISHSRYGWGMQGSTDGASQYLHRQYIDAIFGEEIHDLGFTLVDSKIDNIPYIQNTPVMYWVTYETNLIGDPGLSVWSDTPQQIIAQLPPVWTLGITNYQIQTNAPNASFRIKNDQGIIAETNADPTGLINLNLLQTLTPGEYDIYINAPNFFSYQNQITVIATQMPYVIPQNVVNDDTDGLIHTGEFLQLSFTLTNVGTVDQTGSGTLSLSTTSPNIQILTDLVTFDPIPAGQSVNFANAFMIAITGNFPDDSWAEIVFSATYDGYTSSNSNYLHLNAPALMLNSYQVNNPSPVINPGQSPTISLNLGNDGSGNAYTPMLILFSDSPWVTLSDFELTLPMVPHNGQVEIADAFTVFISESAPETAEINIGYILNAENGPSLEGTFSMHLGMLSYGFEPDTMGWLSLQPNANFTNQWHRSSTRNHTENGGFSMKFGDTGTGDYASSAYGALESPGFVLGLNGELRFWHWMEAEQHSNPIYAWDGGMVQMSLNDGPWNQITPIGGYPCRTYNNPASPFPANTNVWSGTFSWTEAVFDLSQYVGVAKFRFLFGSDGYVSGEGWYVDDVRVLSDPVSNDDPTSIPQVVKLMGNYPNPFNPTTTLSFSLPNAEQVSLEIYNLKGQRVKSLTRGMLPAGKHSYVWNGMDESGQPVASGVYLYRLQAGSFTESRKMMLMK
jgi:hypothetical protein